MRGSSKVYLDGNLVGKSWLHARILFQPLFNLICFFLWLLPLLSFAFPCILTSLQHTPKMR